MRIESSTTPKVQIAIQGGGAKFYSLLGAVEYIARAHAKGDLQVTRVVGTSAGSIAACLLAAGTASIAGLRSAILAIPLAEWEGMFPTPNIVRTAWKVLRNKPLMNHGVLIDLLRDQFDGKQLETLADLQDKPDKGMEVLVTATSLSNGRLVVREGDRGIVESILESCGLPFVFRTCTNSGLDMVVDGGICENLPTEVLEKRANREQYGPIVAISFEDKDLDPARNAAEFAQRLLDAAIRNSVKRAQHHLGHHSVLRLSSCLSTFDFANRSEGLAKQEGSAYSVASAEAQRWFGKRVSAWRRGGVVFDDPWGGRDEEWMRRQHLIYESQHQSSPIRIVRKRLIVIAHSLAGDAQDQEGPVVDEVIEEVEFEASESPIYCYRVSLSASESASVIPVFNFEFEGPDGMECEVVPSLSGEVRGQHPPLREIVLHFLPPLAPGAGKATLRMQDQVENGMAPLRSEGKDDIGVALERKSEGAFPVEVCLVVPKEFGGVRQEGRLEPRGRDQHEGGIPSGEIIPDKELSDLRPNLDFDVWGWRAEIEGLGPELRVYYERER